MKKPPLTEALIASTIAGSLAGGHAVEANAMTGNKLDTRQCMGEWRKQDNDLEQVRPLDVRENKSCCYRCDCSKNGVRENTTDDTLANDLLIGAYQIAEYIYGDPTLRRKIYHLRRARRIPVFVVSGKYWARRSTLTAWIAEQEKHGASNLFRPAAAPVLAKSPMRLAKA